MEAAAMTVVTIDETPTLPMSGNGEEYPVVSEVERDLSFLETLRWMKKAFFDQVAEESGSTDPNALGLLRQDSTYQLAEFFFALQSYGLTTPEHFRRLACLHNDHLFELLNDSERLRRLGLSPERLRLALFSGENMAKLMENFRRLPPSIDQSDLARFLITVMSSETCRKLVIACESAGFLERERSPYGAVLVQSTGRLERIFGECLRESRRRLKGL